MSEGPVSGEPPRRGRKNPDIAARLLAEQLQDQMEEERGLSEAPLEPEGGFSYFRAGRTITAKTSAAHDVGGRGDYPWFTFGITETFDEDDDLEQIVKGLAAVTNSATLLMADDMAARLQEIEDEKAARPITPRSR
jgi:hypothetical protein